MGLCGFTGLMKRAALFDIDGTLVDSNYLHIEAWTHAFADLGIEVDAWRVHRLIGKDSSLLLEECLGDQLDELGDRAKELNAGFYEALAGRARRLARVPELIGELRERGVIVVLATSAPPNELEILLDVIDTEVDHVSSADDVDTAKPEPDIIENALAKAGVEATDAIMIGDTVWDVVAASRAGVSTIGVLTGGVSAGELLEAGAVAVYDDVAQLLEQLDDSPLA